MNEFVLVGCAAAACFSVASLGVLFFLWRALQTTQQNQEKCFEQMLATLKDIQEQVGYIQAKLQEQEPLAEPVVVERKTSKAEESLRIKLADLLKSSN